MAIQGLGQWNVAALLGILTAPAHRVTLLFQMCESCNDRRETSQKRGHKMPPPSTVGCARVARRRARDVRHLAQGGQKRSFVFDLVFFHSAYPSHQSLNHEL